ncbi:MAG TPA: SCP2 sterol-binding domain-containing protein, partial [Candidatus Omnitrophota bacterium]|nr:SCP2 sterol-binding domain-containing protein [Candidatus Omnitrophota bacterium]
MIKVQDIEESITVLFERLALFYNKERFLNTDFVFQFVLSNGDAQYCHYICVSGGRAQSKTGLHGSADLTIYSSPDDFFNLINGSLNPVYGFFLRKYRLAGDISLFWKLGGLFLRRFGSSFIADTTQPEKRKVSWKKPEKVLVINSSPRQKDGFTFF